MPSFWKQSTTAARGATFLLSGVLAGAIAWASGSLQAAEAVQGQWNQFRGPHADGSTRATGLPVKFGDGSPEITWKTEVTGRAWSSPVVWGRQVWVTNAPEVVRLANENEVVNLEQPLRLSAVCLDLETGRVLHDITIFEVKTPQYTHPTNSYASPTPWIEDGRIWLHFGSYGTVCLDTNTGKKLWERTDLKVNHWRGPGSSPVISGDLLFLSFDGFDQQFMVCLNKNTGETVWKRDRGVDYGTDNGDAKKAYSTPLLIEAGGRSLLVSPFASATIAYNPATGEPAWTVHHGGMNAAGRPLFGNGLLYINAGDGKDALIAVRPDGTGDISKTHIAWRTGRLVPKRPSQLLVGENYFMMNDEGVCTCLNAVTGEERWSKRLDGKYWASPLSADGLLYFFSQEGHVPVVRASHDFELVAENRLGDGFTASPAVAGRSLILRSKSHVYRIDRK